MWIFLKLCSAFSGLTMEERRTRQEYEKFLFDIDFWRLKIFLEIYMFGKFNSKFKVSKGTRSHMFFPAGGTPTASLTHISSQTSGARCWLLVISRIGVLVHKAFMATWICSITPCPYMCDQDYHNHLPEGLHHTKQTLSHSLMVECL